MAAGRVRSPLEGVGIARTAVQSGAAAGILDRLATWTSRRS